MDLAELRAGVADVDVSYKGQPFTVGYRPEAISEDDLELLEAFTEKTGVALLRETVKPIVRFIVRWSITEDGEPLDVSDDAVTRLPPRMRVSILEAVMRDFFSPGNESPSDATSPVPAASEGTAPTTRGSSGMRNGQESLPGSSPGSRKLAAVSSGGNG